MMSWKKVVFAIVTNGLLFSGVEGIAQTEDNTLKQAEKKIAKMEKAGFSFHKPEGLEGRMATMLDKRAIVDEKGLNEFLILELSSKHADPEVARDLIEFKLPVELASLITRDILRLIETELVQSEKYWELGGHDYFLEVQLAIDEVALATAVNLTPMKVIYEAERQNSKNFEFTTGLIYSRSKMLELFIFEAGNYEILDSIYWLTRTEQ